VPLGGRGKKEKSLHVGIIWWVALKKEVQCSEIDLTTDLKYYHKSHKVLDNKAD
jgi:hypothetical protein